MKIRKLTAADYPQLIQLWERAKLPIKPRGRDSRAHGYTMQIAAEVVSGAESVLRVLDDPGQELSQGRVLRVGPHFTQNHFIGLARI